MTFHALSRRSLLKLGAAGLATSALPFGLAKAQTNVVLGIVYVGPKDDFGWNQAHAVSVEALKAVSGITVVEEENVPETDAVSKSMESMINLDGANLILATSFVALPLVLREVVPVLEEIGVEQEQAAQSLGAGPVQTFWRITLPAIRWAVVYGVVLSLARSLGEFGAVILISGNVPFKTEVASVFIRGQIESDNVIGAASVSVVLLAISLTLLAFVNAVQKWGLRYDR